MFHTMLLVLLLLLQSYLLSLVALMLGMSEEVLPAFVVMNWCASSSAALALSFTLTVRQRSRNVFRSPLKLSVWKKSPMLIRIGRIDQGTKGIDHFN